MNVLRYTDFFHDGKVCDIRHENNKIEFVLESAEMDKEDMLSEDVDFLSQDWRLKGRLHIEGVKNIQMNDKKWPGLLKLEYDGGRICDLEIKHRLFEISVCWVNFPPQPAVAFDDEFCVLKIEGNKMLWEVMSDLKMKQSSCEALRYDERKSWPSAHKYHNHYHRPNPHATGWHDKYLDAEKNPVSAGSYELCLYPPEWV